MLARLAFVALAIVLVVALLTYFGGRIRSGSEQRAREARRARVEAEAELVAARAQRDATTEGQREAAPVAEAALVENEHAPELPPAADTQRLRGVLVHSSDGRPAAGAALIFWYGEKYTETVTAADGRFVIDAVVPAGAVRAYHRGDVPDPVPMESLDIRPETFLLSARGPGGEAEEVKLELVDPPAWLEVEVVTLKGVPTAAELRWLFRPPTGPGSGRRSQTDAEGRARIAFPNIDPGARMLFFARGADLVSDTITVEAPPSGDPVRIVLDAGGSVRARTLAVDGKPLKDVRVRLEVKNAQSRLLDEGATTDAEGFAVFTAVSPGVHVASYWSEGTSEWVQAEGAVERNRTTDVELRDPGLPLAVAGRVVDAGGLPLQQVQIIATIGDSSTTTVTNEGGAFSVGSAETGSVHLYVMPDLARDRFEPAALEVPFGTRDVLFRQVESRPTTALALEVLERATLARIPNALVLGFVEPQRSDWSFYRAKEGLVSIELKLYDDVWLAVDAVGYRRRVLQAAELARDAMAGGACRVLLEPGLERVLRVLEYEDEAPIAGARVLDGERLVATTDHEGRAAIELASWPVELRVQAAGHVEDVWPCKDWIAELEDGVVWLERVPPEGSASGER